MTKIKSKRSLAVGLAVAAIAVLAVLGLTRRGETQAEGTKIVIGIYAPTVEFGTAQARVTYVQGLAKAVEGNLSGVKVDAQSFASLAQLRKANVDFAIVDGQCYAANSGWKLLANAQVGGGTTRQWALYSSVGPDMSSLRGQKLAYVQTGCNDNAFIENAMLESEVGLSFFSGLVGKPDMSAAVAEVASYKGAQGVFAPVGSQKGLTKVFDTGSVPNPAFVQLNTKFADGGKVASAVVSYGGGGAISGWAEASKGSYTSLSGRMGKVVKRGVFAPPAPVRVDAKDVLIEPATMDDTAMTDVKQHFEKPPDRLD
jgi:hypothetical protein